VQALVPRALLALEPTQVVPHIQAFRYVRHGSWRDLVHRHGGITSVKLGEVDWKVGDEALLVHEYGGIGGTGGEKLASGPVYFGHFAYGFARVIEEPLTGEPRFDFEYWQVYCQNTDGLIAGRLYLSRYLADRQFGWIGLRPTFQLMLKAAAFPPEGLRELALQLDAMTARYRIGDGTGGTFVSAANNCAQDSNRALFAALRGHDESRLLARDLRWHLALFGTPRRDWTDNSFNLGTTMEDEPFDQLRAALGSWRVILPRKAGDTISRILLRHGANAWFLGTSQVHDRTDIAPVVPMTF
jgi:predicted Abi (CAAX) family protease